MATKYNLMKINIKRRRRKECIWQIKMTVQIVRNPNQRHKIEEEIKMQITTHNKKTHLHDFSPKMNILKPMIKLIKQHIIKATTIRWRTFSTSCKKSLNSIRRKIEITTYFKMNKGKQCSYNRQLCKFNLRCSEWLSKRAKINMRNSEYNLN